MRSGNAWPVGFEPRTWDWYQVIELPPVVTLDGLNGEAELSGHPDKEVEKGGEGLRLGAQRESPRVMRKIINND